MSAPAPLRATTSTTAERIIVERRNARTILASISTPTGERDSELARELRRIAKIHS